jgi:uncharacterized membrane protein YgcG
MADVEADVPLVGIPAIDYVLGVCGIEPQKRVSIISEGFVEVADFANLRQGKDIADMAKRLVSLRANQGHARIGQLQIRYLEALVYWTKDKKRRGQPIEAEEWTIDVRNANLEKLDLADAEQEKETLTDPGKFTTSGWVTWELAIVNKLGGIKGVSGVPLSYVIRKPKPDGYEFGNDDELLMYEAPLVGQAFEQDAHAVHRIIQGHTLGTDAYHWIKAEKNKRNGRIDMQLLREHFDGPGVTRKKIAHAEHQIQSVCRYHSEQKYSFEKFVTSMNSAFQVLHECGEEYTEARKVRFLLDAIENNNMDIRSAVTNIRMGSSEITYVEAANKLSEVVSTVFHGSGKKHDNRKVAAVDTNGGRGGRTGGRGGGRGGRGRGGRGGRGGHGRGGGGGGGGGGNSMPQSVNGVDISDVTRSFKTEEWYKLPFTVRDQIHEARDKINKSKRNVSAVKADDTTTITELTTETNAGSAFGKGSYTGSESASKRAKN